MMSAPRRFVVLPDVHIPYQCDAAVDTVFEFLERNQPHDIFQLGDLVDCYAVSRFNKSPDRLHTLQSEIDLARRFLAYIRTICPQSRIYYSEGNHEARLQALCGQHATGLGSLRDLSLRRLLRLDELQIVHCSYLSHHAPYGDELMVRHGKVARMHSAVSAHHELESAHRRRLCNGITGHTHRLGRYQKRSGGRSWWWLEAGHLADREVSREYAQDPLDWQQGIVIGHVDEDGRAHAWCCPISDGGLSLPWGKIWDGKKKEDRRS
jgi:predicted phosphodiesterase